MAISVTTDPLATAAGAVSPTPREMDRARQWAAAKFEGMRVTAPKVNLPNSEPPFSFFCDGKPSWDFLSSWKLERTSQQLDKSRKQHTSIYTDPKTSLQVRCVGVEYNDYPVVEWTVYLKNTSTLDTPIISDFKGIDTQFERCSQGEFVLHTLKGDDCSPDSYEPLNFVLEAGKTKTITAVRGRPTQVVWPYFNIESDSRGVIAAVGWPGQWSADFTRDDGVALRCKAGQELTHFKLKPGEEVRSPLVALLFWEGDYLRSQNIWRRWILAHNMPRIKPLLTSCSGGYFGPSLKVNTQTEKQWIDKFKKEGVDLDYWWMDAGWYVCNGWPETGTWEYDKERFRSGSLSMLPPGGMKTSFSLQHQQKLCNCFNYPLFWLSVSSAMP